MGRAEPVQPGWDLNPVGSKAHVLLSKLDSECYSQEEKKSQEVLHSSQCCRGQGISGRNAFELAIRSLMTLTEAISLES